MYLGLKENDLKKIIRKQVTGLEELQNPADLEHGRIHDRIMERCVPVWWKKIIKLHSGYCIIAYIVLIYNTPTIC